MRAHSLILGTAGHIDHGKTALVKALTGVDTDRLPQEQARGITIDLGFADLDLGPVHLGIVDVPGHERFIRNMLAGAAGVDVALLVVAADDAVMPQTREHLAILKLLGVRRGVIAITKCDLADPEWLDVVEDDVRALVRGSFLEGAPIVRTAATKGTGLGALREAIQATCAAFERAEAGDAFRMAVDRSFVQHGVGTVVTGTVNAGAVAVGDEVEWQPRGEVVRVRGLQSHGAAVERVGRGQRAAVNLIGVHHRAIERGHEIATPGLLEPSHLMTVRLDVLPESPWPIRHRSRLRLHVGTQEIMATVGLLGPSSLEPGASGDAQLATAQPVLAVGGQPFVLRLESPLVTVGGGHVLQPVARRIGRRRGSALGHLEALRSRDPAARVAATLALAGTAPRPPLALARDAAVPEDRVEPIVAGLIEEGVIALIRPATGRPRHLHRDVLDDLEQRILGAVQAEHDREPLRQLVPRARVMRRLEYEDDALIEAIVDRLVETDRLTGDEHNVGDPARRPVLSGAQAERLTTLVEAHRAAGLAPPDPPALREATGASDAELRPLLDLAVERGDLVHLGGGLYLHCEAESDLRRRIAEHLGGDGLTMSSIRDVLGTSRKYAVPMCEYLDRIGVTRRVADRRVLAR